MSMKIGLAALLAVASLSLFAHQGIAATVDTFSFEQPHYFIIDGHLGDAPVSGSFSGTPNAAGIITLDSLISLTLSPSFAVSASFFSFDINGGGSTLDFAGKSSFGGACVGAAAAFGGTINGVYCGPGGYNGFLQETLDGKPLYFATGHIATVTLVSSVTDPSGAISPEPTSWALFGSGLFIAMSLRKARKLAASRRARFALFLFA